MRLNRHELDVIQHILMNNPAAGTAWLFGSRADDAGRGGDIDLYWEPGQKVSLRQALAMEYRLCADCDCKVDLLIRNPGEPEQPIHSIAKRGVRL